MRGLVSPDSNRRPTVVSSGEQQVAVAWRRHDATTKPELRPSPTTTPNYANAELRRNRGGPLVAVTHAAPRHDALGVGRVRLDLGPESFHVYVERLGVTEVVGAPDPVDEHVARQ